MIITYIILQKAGDRDEINLIEAFIVDCLLVERKFKLAFMRIGYMVARFLNILIDAPLTRDERYALKLKASQYITSLPEIGWATKE